MGTNLLCQMSFVVDKPEVKVSGKIEENLLMTLLNEHFKDQELAVDLTHVKNRTIAEDVAHM